MPARSEDPPCLDRLVNLIKSRPKRRTGNSIVIEVMDGSRANHHLKVMTVIQKIAPNAQMTFSDIADARNHSKTIRNATDMLRDILSQRKLPDIINNSWAYPRTPTQYEHDRWRDRTEQINRTLTYDEERMLYPCHIGHPYTRLVREAVQRGIMMVFAAGNRGLDRGEDLFRGRICGANGLPEVITVGATDRSGKPHPSSSYGPSTFSHEKPDIWAPCDYIVNQDLGLFRGTSAAAPIVTGLLALAKEANPHLRPRNWREGLSKIAPEIVSW